MKNVAKKPDSRSNANVIALLNQTLADMLALKSNVKQAHWNVKGVSFIALHELFDQVATAVDGYADTIAERAVQLGGMAEGNIAHIAKRAGNANAPIVSDQQKLVRSVGDQLKAVADQVREAIDTADDLDDKVTADIFTQIAGGLDKYQWFVSSHQS